MFYMTSSLKVSDDRKSNGRDVSPVTSRPRKREIPGRITNIVAYIYEAKVNRFVPAYFFHRTDQIIEYHRMKQTNIDDCGHDRGFYVIDDVTR
jgi:hypothetical protein